MITTKTSEGVNLQILVDKLKANRKVFYWALPIVFVASLVWALLSTKEYTSKIVIASETQLSYEENRVYTYNRPENYDLGILKTDNVLRSNTYKEIIGGQSFCMGLLEDTVETADGNFKGTLENYLKANQHHLFRKKDAKKPDPKREQADLAGQLEKMIDASYDDMTSINTVKVTTPDSRVSQMLANAVYDHLSDYIRDYQDQKMQLGLKELEQVRDEAKTDYEQAKAAGSADQERLLDIYQSFQRQTVIYKAQMVYTPAIAKIQDASISYLPSGTGTAIKTVGLTLLATLLLAAWICRKELIQWF